MFVFLLTAALIGAEVEVDVVFDNTGTGFPFEGPNYPVDIQVHEESAAIHKQFAEVWQDLASIHESFAWLAEKLMWHELAFLALTFVVLIQPIILWAWARELKRRNAQLAVRLGQLEYDKIAHQLVQRNRN